jgi:hypothetical protein
MALSAMASLKVNRTEVLPVEKALTTRGDVVSMGAIPKNVAVLRNGSISWPPERLFR